ncbi:MAG: c-type cytochrome [Gammaproteobacteria bacterium]|nr:c-type cytochrome [Gammaproteobacteria bacterium]
MTRFYFSYGRAFGVALLAGGMAVPVLAQDAQTLQVRALAATCANCHGTDGRSPEGSAVPSLAGMPRDYLIGEMKKFVSGERPATIMHQLAKGYSDQQMVQMASYFSSLKK